MNPVFLRLLLWLYVPFLLFVCAGTFGFGGLVLLAMASMSCSIWIAVPLLTVLGATLTEVAWALQGLITSPIDEAAGELAIRDKLIEPLWQWIGEIARKQNLTMPDEIRFTGSDIAYVYENSRRAKVLVLGGMAMGVFTQEALAGVIAHELAHFSAGDTALSRQASRLMLVMALLEHRIGTELRTQLNPLVWLIQGYHSLLKLVWAAHSREQEYAADRYLVEQAGNKMAATALLYLTVSERLPFLRIDNIAKSHVAANEPIKQIFAEHWQRAQTIPQYEWDDACNKELKKKTSLLDSHPCLRDRLKAMGISPQKARKLMVVQTGPPARDLFPHWPIVENELTTDLINAYRVAHEAKRELAQIFSGRPI